jgi:hypothetical protein
MFSKRADFAGGTNYIMRKLFFLLLILITTSADNLSAQIKVTEEKQIASAATVTGVVLHADPRLAILEKKHKNIQMGVIRSGRGFRIQIYNGSDRNKATQIKVDFMRRFPNVRTYLSYVQPQFRLKVGDFRTRAEAQEIYNAVRELYNPSMIVQDIIVINTLKDD